MDAPNREVKKLAVIVGGNPLPNYIAIQMLKPREIVFFYTSGPEGTKDSKKIMEWLQKTLIESDSDGRWRRGKAFHEYEIQHRAEVQQIREDVKLARLEHRDIDHLHYSGGTKPMAAHIHAVFASDLVEDGTMIARLGGDQFSYLDEVEGLLRFDKGKPLSIEAANIDLTLAELRQLHGVKLYSHQEDIDYFNPSKPGLPNKTDARRAMEEALSLILNDDSKLKQERVLGRNSSHARISKSKRRKKIGEKLRQRLTTLFHQERSAKDEIQRAAWKNFIEDNGWLEQWTAYAIQELLAPGGTLKEINVARRYLLGDVEGLLGKPEPTEIDVAFVYRHRFYVISCSVSIGSTELKLKLFEAITRARQLGGEMARVALMSLVTRDVIDKLRTDAMATGIDLGTVAIFGVDHIRALMNPELDQSKPYLAEVKRWLGLMGR